MSRRKSISVTGGVQLNLPSNDQQRNLDNAQKYGRRNSKKGEAIRSEDIFHPVLVPALDALIGDPKLLEPNKETPKKAEMLLIPMQYINRLCDFRDELSNRGEAAKALLKAFSRILEDVHYNKLECHKCQNGMRIKFIENSEQEFVSGVTDRKSSAANALATAHFYNQLHKGQVAIMSGDDYMFNLALSHGIDIAKVNPDVYTGRRKLALPERAYNQWFSKGYLTEKDFAKLFPKEEPLLLNEFVEFIFNEDILPSYCTEGKKRKGLEYRIGRFRIINEEPVLQKLQYISDLPPYIQPRNAGQAMYAEALMAPVEEIPIVICPSTFGTGKTYLSAAIGIFLTTPEGKNKIPRFERFFICPRDSELGKEIGFLPGTEVEKTIAKAMPIVDNFREYFKNRGDKGEGGAKKGKVELDGMVEKYIEDHCELVSIINMGGRNISDAWIFYDEAQDMERFQINQLMKRIGNGSKMIITGDPNQVFNRHMNSHSNGLSYAATKMAGSPFAAVITMTEDEITRSVAAQEIARLLDH